MSDPRQFTHLQFSRSILGLCRNNRVDGSIDGSSFGVETSVRGESKQEIRCSIIGLQDQGVWIDEGPEFKW
jgi:hypothetical protein